jgi:hypothetical protein
VKIFQGICGKATHSPHSLSSSPLLPPSLLQNPIGAGDAFGNSAVILNATKTSPTSMTIVTRPYQWACDDVPCECLFVQTISLSGAAAEVSLTLQNARTDGPVPFGGQTQELPAVYVVGSHCHLFTYNGSAPFTAATPEEVPSTWPWSSYLPSERWMAFSNSSDPSVGESVGIWSPFFGRAGAGRFFAGNNSDTCSGNDTSPQVGYIAPWIEEELDATIVYSYNFSVILGTVNDVQAYAAAKHAAGLDESLAPHHVFGPTREHYTFANGQTDGGWPVPADGPLLSLNTTDGLFHSAYTGAWKPSDAPVLYVNGSWPAGAGPLVAIYFEQYGTGQPCPTCYVAATRPGAGQPGVFEVVPVPMSSNALYASAERIARIALVVSGGTAVGGGAAAQIKSITATDPREW